MLTELTQTAIAVLCDISAGSHPYRTAQLHIDPEYLIGILTKLETGGLVRHRDTSFADTLSSYELVRPYTSISLYNPQIQISAESETKRSIFRKRDKTKRSKKESAQHSKSRNKSFVMTSVSAL